MTPSRVSGRVILAALAAAVALAGVLAAPIAHATSADTPARGIRLTRFTSGLDKPVHLVAAPGDDRLYVVEQPGRIRVVEKDGTLRREPFLDLTDRVGTNGSERGLLGLAFHPRYRENGFLYVDYTDRNGDTRVERYTARADRRSADPTTAHLVLQQDQPFANHNGGHVLFGPDGMLYVTFGDGGSGGDPGNRAQNLGTLLGKIVRLDVDHGDPYAIPRDNPFAGRPGARGEIWAWGLRNPWRIAFDPPSGLLYIADVGQNQWEEVDVSHANRGGLNYGWRLFEGTHDYKRERNEPRDLVRPQVEYPHSEGCSITGGVVYRGHRVRALAGAYLYADYCSGWLRSFREVAGRAAERHQWEVESPGQVTSFGADRDGEVYVVCHDGAIYRIDPDEFSRP